MTVALLDHPWPLDAGLNPGSDAVDVLIKFLRLIERYSLTPSRFVSPQEYQEMWGRLDQRPSRSRADILRVAGHLLRVEAFPADTAAPDPEPPSLSLFWKQTLRAEIKTTEHWRVPQIVVPEIRRSVWPADDEVPIRCSDQPGKLEMRLVVILESYDAHPHIISDYDPWRHWERRFPPMGPRARPCVLPRPPVLENVPLEKLAERLKQACSRGWSEAGRFYFVPPSDYDPMNVPKHAWRGGRAFKLFRAKNRSKLGPIDHAGRVWEWHDEERHWDVQLPNGKHIRISHEGRDLDE